MESLSAGVVESLSKTRLSKITLSLWSSGITLFFCLSVHEYPLCMFGSFELFLPLLTDDGCNVVLGQ